MHVMLRRQGHVGLPKFSLVARPGRNPNFLYKFSGDAVDLVMHVIYDSYPSNSIYSSSSPTMFVGLVS
jgi:hypothetical protein